MKSKDVKLNQTYLVRVSGNIVPVRITREHPSGTGYYGTNTLTGREIRLKTAARLRRVAPPSPRAFKSQPDERNFDQAWRDMPSCVPTDPIMMNTINDLRWACQIQLDLITEKQDGTEEDDPNTIRQWLRKYGTPKATTKAV